MFQQIVHVLMKKPPVFSAATSVPRIVSSGMLKHPALKGSSKIDLLLFASKKIKFLETYQQWAQEGSKVNTDLQYLLNQHKPLAYKDKLIIFFFIIRGTYLTFPVVKLRGRYRKESISASIFVVLAYILFS